DRACASAAIVRSSLLPCDVMKSSWTSAFSLAAHSSTSALTVMLDCGTKWSQSATESFPAAWAPRTNGIDRAAPLTAVAASNRRRVKWIVAIVPPYAQLRITTLSRDAAQVSISHLEALVAAGSFAEPAPGRDH